MQTVIVDIDGTISKLGDRLKYLEQSPEDWDSFYEACDEDKPIKNIIELVETLSWDYNIVFCTGRRESVRNKTINWLHEKLSSANFYHDIDEALILMRKDGDFRHDTIIKPELLAESNIVIKDIAFVLEDRNAMVVKWREIGLTCLQVADGNF